MDKFSSECISLVSFDKIYSQNIRPKLEEIDIFLKSNTIPYAASDVAKLLSVETDDLLDAMSSLEISTIDKISFFSLLFSLPSYICKLIKRQWQYGAEKVYDPQMISHIYQLNIHKVKSAFDELNVQYINDNELSLVFERIYTTIFTM
ncbi:hypothetical protein [Cellulosilyticum sp. I15G10I2]|uniref:hypothetical protein n=1 Tax=Cellulosilyticum sp. I15G10I2 TaxID=1892843 RepID=UPI00085CBB20|nr:hypothetical protein [Cellulosilyticum sp. I15G10I2]